MLFIPLLIFIFIFVLWLYSFYAIDWISKEEKKKMYNLGKFKYLFIHYCREIKRSWPKTKEQPKKDEKNARIISAFVCWLQIVNLIYLLAFISMLIMDSIIATYMSWFVVLFLLSLYAVLWVVSIIYCIAKETILNKKAKKEFEKTNL